MKVRKINTLPLYELILISLGIVSLTSLSLLVLGTFKPLYAIIGSIIILVSIFVLFNLRIDFKDKRFSWIIIVILLFGLVLRLQPWIYLEGGQDEGVYISMSKQYETSGKFSFDDISQKFVHDSKDLEEKYTSEKLWSVLGIKVNNDTGKLYYDFYPLHPLLMSVTGYVLGSDNRVYSVTLFSIISLIGAYLLAFELTGKKLTGYIAAGILTVNPLHLYFSRFPVTEIIALALSLNILYFLILAWKSNRFLYLAITLLLINMFLYLRLTWIIAMPFCFIVSLVAILYAKNKEQKRNWIIWSITLLLSFLLSILFYYLEFHFLYKHFFAMVFKYIPEPLFYILLFSLPILIYFLVAKFRVSIKKIFEYIYNKRTILIVISLLILLIYSGYSFYIAGFTNKLVGTVWQKQWNMAHGGWYTIKDQALTSIILYLSPFAFLAFIFFIKRINTVYKLLVFFFLLSYLGYDIVLTKYIPYQFYFARYQLSEIVPLLYIFVSIFLVDVIKQYKWLVITTLILIFSYNIFFSAYQFQGYVGTTPVFFNKLKQDVSKNNVVIYYDPTDWSKSFFFTPLKYYFNVPSIMTTNINDTYLFANEIKKSQSLDSVYILSTVKLQDANMKLMDTINYERGFYANANEGIPPLTWKVNDNEIPFCNLVIPSKYCGGLIPIKYNKGNIDMYLYKY